MTALAYAIIGITAVILVVALIAVAIAALDGDEDAIIFFAIIGIAGFVAALAWAINEVWL